MYGKPRLASVDKIRFLLLKAKLHDDVSPKPKQDIDFSMMPPPSGGLLEHLKRVNYVVTIWRQVASAIIDIPKPKRGNHCGAHQERFYRHPLLI